MTKYFADSYAYIEILRDNPNYRAYKQSVLITHKINVAEVTYWLIRTNQSTMAKEVSKRLWNEKAPITHNAVQKGMQFKHLKRKDKLSYADCIGYALAAELNIPFLTGDEKFKDLPNVEWVR